MHWLTALSSLLASVAIAQVPPKPTLLPPTSTAAYLGPAADYYVSTFGLQPDGGGVTGQQWALWPTVDGGTYVTRVSSELRFFDPGPEIGALLEALPDCAPISLAARTWSDAGPSEWSDASTPVLWDETGPATPEPGAVLEATSSGGVTLELGATDDACTGASHFDLFWARRDLDSGAVRDLGLTAPLDAGLFRTTMGDGDWALAVRAVDRVSNVSPLRWLDGGVRVQVPGTLAAPTNVRFGGAPWVRGNNDLIAWTAAPGAVSYVLVCHSAGASYQWVKRTTATSSPALPIPSSIPLGVSIAAIFPDGGVSPWAMEAQPLRVDTNTPTVPQGLTATWDGGVVVLSWLPSTDSLSGLRDYVLEQQRTGEPWGAAGTSLSPGLVVAAASGEWWWRVAARDQAPGASAWSAPAMVWVDVTPPPAPGTPSLQRRDGEVAVAWSPASDSPDASTALTYALERGPLDGGAWTLVMNTSLTAVLDAPPGGAFTWRVNATDAYGNTGPWSAPSEALEVDPQPETPPDGPRHLTVSCTHATATPPFALLSLLVLPRRRGSPRATACASARSER